MSNLTPVSTPLAPETIEKVLLNGDLKALRPAERINYYNSLCESLTMNPLTRPFDYLDLNGRLVLYPNKGGGEQLRQIRKVSIQITAREKIGDVYVVTARARLPDGREDEATGAVEITNVRGEKLANAYMKAETKAKRRVTLSICGLNMVDDSEVDSIEGARRVSREEAESMPTATYQEREVAPTAPAPSNSQSSDPWDYRLPTSWKTNGGKSLRELGLDGVMGVVSWLKSLDRLSPKNQEILDTCDLALKTRQNPLPEPAPEFEAGEWEDSAYDMATGGGAA